MITELVSNAVFFADAEQPRVGVSIENDGASCTLTVSDNGAGIADEDLPYIFDPFYTTRPEAVGMGLSIVNRIASGYNWKVNVSCPEEGGTVFMLVIPV